MKNRQIKFRAWDEHKRKMIDNPVVSDESDGGETASVLLNTAINCLGPYYVLMQFTGLQDKNGIDIYEGDIVETWTAAPWDWDIPILVKGEITFGDPFTGSFCFKAISDDTCELYNLGEVKIIGNIYENEDLIK